MLGRLGLLAVVVAAGATPERASAHAAFVGAEPTAGGRAEAAPRQVVLSFTEPLNGRLSRIELEALSTGKAVKTANLTAERSRLSVQPVTQLADGAYRVTWHTVSALDGHALEGTYSFGVRAPAAAGGQSIEQSPLARSGWLRIALRGRCTSRCCSSSPPCSSPGWSAGTGAGWCRRPSATIPRPRPPRAREGARR